MIEHIEIEGFKSLEKVSLNLGPLNIFVGTNASGKSNFLEALKVLQGIGYGYTVDAILNGRPSLGNTEAWEGIRGGSRFARFLRSTGNIQFRVRSSLPPAETIQYAITISAEEGTVVTESFDGTDLQTSDRFRSGLRETAKGKMRGRDLAFVLDLCDVVS